MKKYSGILKKCGLFRNIAEKNLFTLLHCLGARVAVFSKKQTIIAEGSRAEHICVMLSGSAQMVRVDYYGNRSIISGIEPSEVFGEAFACTETEEMPVTVIANEPCEVLLIDCRHIIHACPNACGFHQQIIFNLMRNLAEQNLLFHQKLEITSCRTTREKLMAYLLVQAKKHGSKRFSIPFDRQELADYLEVDRSGLSAEISKLRSEGVLTSSRKEFELL